MIRGGPRAAEAGPTRRGPARRTAAA